MVHEKEINRFFHLLEGADANSLSSKVQSDNPNERVAAVRLIGARKLLCAQPVVRELFRQELTSHSHSFIELRALAFAVGELGDEESLPLLADAVFKHSIAPLAEAATTAFIKIGAPSIAYLELEIKRFGDEKRIKGQHHTRHDVEKLLELVRVEIRRKGEFMELSGKFRMVPRPVSVYSKLKGVRKRT